MQTRKVIQVSCAVSTGRDTGNSYLSIVALCNDGTIYEKRQGCAWEKVSDIPEDKS